MQPFILQITCEADRAGMFEALCFPNVEAARYHVCRYTAAIADERRHLRAFLSAAPDPDAFVRRYMQPPGHRWVYARVVCARLRAWRTQRIEAQARVARMREAQLQAAFAAERRRNETKPIPAAAVLTIAPYPAAPALAVPSIQQRKVA